MRALWLMLLLAWPSPALAANVPLPRPKPILEEEQDLAAAAIPFPKMKAGGAPPQVEEEDAPPPKASGGDVKKKFAEAGRVRSRWPKAEVAAAQARCVELLAGLDIIWRPDNPIGAPGGGCGTAMPIAVSDIAGVRLRPVATLNCDMAAALHHWIVKTVQPAARKSAGSKLTEITNASSYACRRRNNSRRGKLSEHANANAFDISEFRFANGKTLSVQKDYRGVLQSVGLSGRGNFLRTVRRGACVEFNTVLGPGEANHGDHFHFDLMPLRPGRSKMCR